MNSVGVGQLSFASVRAGFIRRTRRFDLCVLCTLRLSLVGTPPGVTI